MTPIRPAPDFGPTVAPPSAGDLGGVLSRNIEALTERKKREDASASIPDKIADAVTTFAGSMASVLVHTAVYGLWALSSTGWIPVLPRFDPTFVGLATVASVEGIYLTTFVLISQNRATRAADRRADLDLQINLLSEHEVTRLVGLTAAIAKRLGIDEGAAPELDELERDVAPEAVLDSLDQVERSSDRAAARGAQP